MIGAFLKDENGGMSLEAAIITATFVALAIVLRKQLKKIWDTVAEEMAESERKIKG